MKREQAEVKLAENQPELGEDQEEDDDDEFLKPELACEIYAALPAAHQLRLLILCRDIFELGPSTDEWIRWKILQWAGNRWNPNGSDQQDIQSSGNGLNIARIDSSGRYFLTVRAIHGVEFLPTRLEGPQVCYFEMKYVEGYFWFGFCSGEWTARIRNSTNCFGLISINGSFFNGITTHRLPGYHSLQHESALIGCGLWKQFGKRKVFFTKNGQLIGKPILLPSTAPNELFPFITLLPGPHSPVSRFEATNFGLNPFQFKYKGNEEKLLEEINID